MRPSFDAIVERLQLLLEDYRLPSLEKSDLCSATSPSTQKELMQSRLMQWQEQVDVLTGSPTVSPSGMSDWCHFTATGSVPTFHSGEMQGRIPPASSPSGLIEEAGAQIPTRGSVPVADDSQGMLQLRPDSGVKFESELGGILMKEDQYVIASSDVVVGAQVGHSGIGESSTHPSCLFYLVSKVVSPMCVFVLN